MAEWNVMRMTRTGLKTVVVITDEAKDEVAILVSSVLMMTIELTIRRVKS